MQASRKGLCKRQGSQVGCFTCLLYHFLVGPHDDCYSFLADLFWGRQAVEEQIYEQEKNLVGNRAALQIQEVIKNASVDGGSTLTTTVGFIAALIGATTVFAEIQDSINSIWRLRAKAEKGLVKMLMSRLLSFSLVVSLGFLLLVSLIINTAVESLMDHLQQRYPQTAVVLFYILNLVLTVAIIWFLFAIIFKVLPDAVIRWKDVTVGALFTTLLFMGGKFAITYYIGRSDIGSIYGTAGSLVVLLFWIYFSANILYFSAEFTKAYAVKFGTHIKPNEYAVMVQMVQVESGKESVQENEEDEEGTAKELQKVQDKRSKKK